MASEYVSIWRGDLQITYSFLVRKDYSHAGRELQQVEVFPVGTVGGGALFLQLLHKLIASSNIVFR